MITLPYYESAAFVVICLAVMLLASCRGDQGNADGKKMERDDRVSTEEHNDSGDDATPPQLAKGPELLLVPLEDRVGVKIIIRNQGAESFVWDSKFSVFMRWRVTTDSGQVIDSKSISILDKAPTADTKQRFVTVAPGASVSKDVEITKSFRSFVFGSGVIIPAQGPPHTVPTGYEEMARFEISQDIGFIRIKAVYVGVIAPEAESFMFVFTESPIELGFLREQIQSNELQIDLR